MGSKKRGILPVEAVESRPYFSPDGSLPPGSNHPLMLRILSCAGRVMSKTSS